MNLLNLQFSLFNFVPQNMDPKPYLRVAYHTLISCMDHQFLIFYLESKSMTKLSEIDFLI